jgi:hypothetical protein
LNIEFHISGRLEGLPPVPSENLELRIEPEDPETLQRLGGRSGRLEVTISPKGCR